MQSFRNPKKNALWVSELIESFDPGSGLNTAGTAQALSLFGKPLVGFCNGNDPIFAVLKSWLGSQVLSPKEFFSRCFPHLIVRPDEVGLIAWALPVSPGVLEQQASAQGQPAQAWVDMCHYGQSYAHDLRVFVMQNLMDAGMEADAPLVSSAYDPTAGGESQAFRANWSDEHAAFAAGLGTFGLSPGLITQTGKAMFCGSVVAKLSLMPARRPYGNDKPNAYCGHFGEDGCDRCIERCPAGAMGSEGLDLAGCQKHTAQLQSQYGFAAPACGLCQAGVPCAGGIPEPQKV